jgi:GxxExxY protein
MTQIDKENRDSRTEEIIACCFKVHNEIGPGFPERIYHRALIEVLKEDGIKYESEKEFEVTFRDKKIGKFRCDLLIGGQVIVELKAVTGVMPVLFHHQVLAYLKAASVKTGLLINFGNKSCDIKRLSM